MAETKQVNIRVPKPTKDKWEEYAEERYGSITKLITTAVEKEMSGPSEGAEVPPSNAPQELLETIDRLENTVSGMDTRLESVQETVQETGPDISIKAAVRETLPEATEEPEAGLTVTQVAARLNARETDVKVALEELTESNEVRGLKGGPENQAYYARRSD